MAGSPGFGRVRLLLALNRIQPDRLCGKRKEQETVQRNMERVFETVGAKAL